MRENKDLKYCRIYMTSDDEGPYYYLRIGRLETNQFPHGLALATKCRSKEEVVGFAKLVDEYLRESFIDDTLENDRADPVDSHE